MWDNVMSYIISCIFDLFLEEIKNDFDLQDLKINGMFWGDDQIIRLDNCTEAETFKVWNKWIYTMLKYNINVNRKKSLVSKQGIFCEMYTENSDIPLQKTLVYILTPLDSLRGCCTYERKVLWSGYQDLILQSLPWFHHFRDSAEEIGFQLLSDVQELIGYEFNKFERNVPFHLGGWNLMRDEDGNIDLLNFIWERFNSIPKGFINVGFDNPTMKRSYSPTKDFKKLLKDQYFNELLDVLDGNNNFYYSPASSLKSKFMNLCLGTTLSQKKIKKSWIKAQAERQKSFNSRQTHTQQKLLYKLFSEGSLKGQIKKEYLIHKLDSQLVYYLDEEIYKNKLKIPKERALLYLAQKNY